MCSIASSIPLPKSLVLWLLKIGKIRMIKQDLHLCTAESREWGPFTLGTPWDSTHVLFMHILISMISLLVRVGTTGVIKLPKIGNVNLNCFEIMSVIWIWWLSHLILSVIMFIWIVLKFCLMDLMAEPSNLYYNNPNSSQ